MSTNFRRTKILATLGPATDEPGVLEQLIIAGVNVVRLNFSHGTPEQHGQRVAKVREIAASIGREVGVLADLQGPKIRVGEMVGGNAGVELIAGNQFVFTNEMID